MRTLVDIPDRDIKQLDELAAAAKRSRAAEIREAIRLHLERKTSNDWIHRGAGYWKDRKDIGDPVEYQRAARADRSTC
ncbi:MAG TPA: ribbon-helix-helix protein, CopG family [Sphingomicrobium sp.]|nr:ribbon-helix-helix protein, CopG family [Sphingomicrobium sp.]